MKFSVLIANYNNARFLKEAIDSVVQQTYNNWEIILVDDGSKDNFEEVIRDYISDKRIRIFFNSVNKGCGYTKNRCAELATGEIMGFLDPDDKLAIHALQILIDAHKKYPNAGIIHSTHYICDERMTVKRIAEYVKALPPRTPYLLLNDGRIHHFATFSKRNFLKTGGINTQLRKAVDQDLYYQLEQTGDVIYIPEPLYYYRIHSGGISTTGKELETAIIHFQIVREACMKKIKQNSVLMIKDPLLKKAYRLRYHKISVFYWARRKRWHLVLYHIAIYPFIGGASNIYNYLKKLPVEGMGLLRKSFTSNYQIK